MTRATFTLALLLAGATRAQAVTNDCRNAGDGTPCAGPCIAAGTCRDGTCVANALRADGAACSSGNRCSAGDFCAGGECIPGADPVGCPAGDGVCLVGECDPSVGCTLRNICDLAGQSDMAPSAADAETPADAGSGAPPMSRDAGSTESTDRTGWTDPISGEVRGSSVARFGCEVARASMSDLTVVVLLALTGLGLRAATRRRPGRAGRAWRTDTPARDRSHTR